MPEKAKKSFVIISQDWSGEGWAKMLTDESHDVLVAYKNENVPPEKEEQYELIGEGLIEKMPLDDFMKERAKHRNDYIIFDQNFHSDISEKLSGEGFPKVFGATEFMNKMEHDRNFAVEAMKKCGFDIPETHEFSSLDEGINFVERHEEEAWVFKPDEAEDSSLTFVPSNWEDEKANAELLNYMKYLDEDPGTYILQKRIKGVEINVEAWFFKGEPFFSFCCLENKRKLNRDAGCNVGCAQDIAFILPLQSRLVKETIGRCFDFYKGMKYTGFADVNCILADNKYYFLEACARWGYNSHPNLFKNLAIDGFGEIMADFIDGNIKDFYKHFRGGFGASILLYTDCPKKVPLMIDETVEKNFYHFDTYVEDGQLLTAGYAEEIGILCAYGATIEDAANECLNIIDVYENVNCPNLSYRSDLPTNFGANSPIARYRALEGLGLLR